MKIEPTIGRIIWLFPNGAKIDAHNQPVECAEPFIAAIVCHIISGDRVNVRGFTQGGRDVFFRGLPILEPCEEKPPGPFCTWMPYQLGQAKKTEEAIEAGKEIGEQIRTQIVNKDTELPVWMLAVCVEIRSLQRQAVVNWVGDAFHGVVEQAPSDSDVYKLLDTLDMIRRAKAREADLDQMAGNTDAMTGAHPQAAGDDPTNPEAS